MNTYIFIHGGESFATKTEYLEWIRSTAVEWNLDPFSEGTESKKWKNELAKKLTKEGNRVYMPNFPNPQNAKYEEWKLFFEAWIAKVEIIGNLHLLGNSLGGCFLLRYFSEEQNVMAPEKIHTIHLVAACLSAGDFHSPDNYEFLRKLESKVHIWHAEDDTVVPFSTAKELEQILPDAQIHFFGSEKGYGHFYPLAVFPELEGVMTQK